MKAFALGLCCLVLMACVPIEVGAPGSVPAGCVDVGSDITVFGLTWTAGSSRLVVTGQMVPFASGGAGNAVFSEVAWPSKTVTRTFTVADVIGSPEVGADGTVYWAQADGIWSRSTDGAPARLVGLDGNAIEDLRWTHGALLALSAGVDGATLLSVPLPSGGAPTQVAPTDPSIFAVWASADRSRVVITRHPTGQPLQFAVQVAGQTTSVYPSNFAGFGWVTADGARIVYRDPSAGLVTSTLADPAAVTPVVQGLPTDLRAVSEPSSSGVIAYAGGNLAWSTICFTSPVGSSLWP